MLSSRPDLYAVKPKLAKLGAAVLDWRSLGSLLSAAGNPAAAAPGWFGPIPVGPATAQQKVARFLLVPDPGDWLNPPHLHDGEAIDVRLKDGQTIQLVERTGVTVCGRLSFGSMKPNPRAVLLLADAIVE